MDGMIVIVLQSAVTAAVPLLLAGTGELIAERAGIINVGIEGLMLCGCIAAFAGGVLSGSPWIGLGAALIASMVLAALFAVATVWARTEQIVTGMAVNLLAVGVSGTAWRILQARGFDQLPASAGWERLHVPFLGDVPLLGPIVMDHYALWFVAVALIAVLAWLDRRTRAGLIIRALGDAPAACAAAGIDVRRWRIGALIFAGALAGAAGAYLSIMRTHGFAPDMTGGQGFLVLALVIFGRWRLRGLLLGCLLFGLLDAVQQQLQGAGFTNTVPWQWFRMLPYVAALVALAAWRRGGAGPVFLGRPWGG